MLTRIKSHRQIVITLIVIGIITFGLIFFFSQIKPIEYPKAESALDAGREFIDAFLKGDTERAEAYMIKDDENKSLLKKLHRQLSRRSTEDQQGYKESSIIIGDVDNVSENEVIIQYKSSFDRIGRKVKVINTNGEWLVDLKYTTNPNM